MPRTPIENADAPERQPWHSVDAHLREHWREGEHVSIIAQTGGGKSYLATRGLLPLRQRVVAIDVKGDDETLTRAGLKRTARMPGRAQLAWDTANERPTRYRLHVPYGSPGTSSAVHGAFKGVWQRPRKGDEGWTLYVDEGRIISDRNYLGMGKHLDVVWLTGRSRPVTLIVGTQQPVFMPSAFYTQPRWLFLGKLGDKRAVRRLAEIGGDVDMLLDTVPRLADREFLILGPDGYRARSTYAPPRKAPAKARRRPERAAAPGYLKVIPT